MGLRTLLELMLLKLAPARYDSGGETLIRTITADETFRALVARLRDRPGAVAVEGLGGSSAPIPLALLARQRRFKTTGRVSFARPPPLREGAGRPASRQSGR